MSATARHLARCSLVVAALAVPSLGSAESPAEAEVPREGTESAFRIHGVTVVWDRRGGFRAPTADEAARFGEALLQLQGALPDGLSEVKVEPLPGGRKRARVPLELVNLALVRFDAAGAPTAMCVDDARGARELLRSPIEAAEWEEE